MGAVENGFNDTYRDFATDGVQSSGIHNPEKADQRALGALIEDAIETIAAAGIGIVSIVYGTRAELDADLAHDADTLALVYADADTDNNEIYRKAGVSGGGGWARLDLLHGLVESLFPLAAEANRDASFAENSAESVTPHQLALQVRRAPVELQNADVSDPNAQILTAVPPIGGYYNKTVMAWRPSIAPTTDEFTIDIDGKGPLPVYGWLGGSAASAVGRNVRANGTVVLTVNVVGADTFLTITGGLPATEEQAAEGEADHVWLTPKTGRIAARPEALAVESEYLRATAASSGLRFGYSFQRPPMDGWRKWKFFDLDLRRVIAWDGAKLTFDDTGEELAWHEKEGWCAGAYQIHDFINDRYRLDGEDVALTDLFSTVLTNRTGSADGLTFNGTTLQRADYINTVIEALVAQGVFSFAMEVKAANFNALATLLDFAATSSSSNNRIQLQRRPTDIDPGDGEQTQLSQNLQFTSTRGGVPVQLRLAPKDGTTDSVFIYGCVSAEHIRAADHNGAGEMVGDVDGFPINVGKGSLGATQSGTGSQPFNGSILRLAFWRKERPAPQESVRERHVTTFNGVNFIHQTPQEPHSMRFLGKVADSPVRMELKSEDKREADAASYAGRVECAQETDMLHGTAYSFGYTMFMPHFQFEATDDILAYLITMQNHGAEGREPWADLKWLNGVPHIRAQHVPAGGAYPADRTIVVDRIIDLPLQQENYLYWEWKTADDASGFFRFWLNGDQLVDYTGPVGWLDEGTAGYSKFGLYRPANIDGDYSVAAIYDNVRHSTEDLSSLITDPEPIRSVYR